MLKLKKLLEVKNMNEYRSFRRQSPQEKFPLEGSALMKVAVARSAILRMSEDDVKTAASEMLHNLVYASKFIQDQRALLAKQTTQIGSQAKELQHAAELCSELMNHIEYLEHEIERLETWRIRR